jgi:oligosaccharyltransferase complex subunit alpha (ribophorin I)
VRNINLEKAYFRETIKVVVQNIEKQPQRDYFLPFPSDVVPNIGGLEVRDKNDPEKGRLHLELSEIDPSRLVLRIRITDRLQQI